MVSSTVPRLEDRWPPVWLTDSRMKVRSSSASRCSPRRSRARSVAGSSTVLSSSYAAGSYSVDPATEPLPGRSAFPIALIGSNYPANRESLSEANTAFPHLEFSQHDEIGKLGESSRAAAQIRNRGLRLFAQFFGERSCAREPERRDVGRLVVRGVLADGLAERRGRGLLVENVVDHLKSEPDALRVVIEVRKLSRRERVRAARAERDGRADQRSGLVDVHVFELRHGQGLAHAREIDRLPARHAAAAARGGEDLHHFDLSRGIIGE